MAESKCINYLRLLGISLAFLNACSVAKPILREEVQGLGRFEFREAAGGVEGGVVGAPHGRTDRGSDRLAKAISDRTGAGLVIGYGFKSRRLGVAQPVVRSRPYLVSRGSLQRGSVFKEYKSVLRQAAKGELDVYVGVHRSTQKEVADRIEVATSGLTFEQAALLKDSYTELRDELIKGTNLLRLSMVIEPLDRISWRASGVKHHGVLLVAKRGLNLRVPQALSTGSAEATYTEILSRWVDKAVNLLRENSLVLPQIQVKLMDLGRLELLQSRKRWPGIVIGAPHGSFDEYTAEMVDRLSYQTGFAAVIAKGFTPTEASGWRINVNRPTEKTFLSDGLELHSPRARRVYDVFRDLVFKASGGDLKLYVDIHQYNTDNKIQVATVGISRKQARVVKMLYHKIRDRILWDRSDVPSVEFLIEPLEEVEIGAWGAKAEGILSVAKRSLHIEMPSHEAFASSKARDAYTRIFAALLRETTSFLLSGQGGTRTN